MASLGTIKVVIDATTKAFISKLKEADSIAEAKLGSIRDKAAAFGQAFADRLNSSTEGLHKFTENINFVDRATIGLASTAEQVSYGIEQMFSKGTKESAGFRSSMIESSKSVSAFADRLSIAAGTIGPLISLSARAGTVITAVFGSILAFSPKMAKVFTAVKAGFMAMLGPISIVVAVVAGAGLLIALNFEKAVGIITNVTNAFIRLYNRSLPVRVFVQSLNHAFRTMGELGKYILSQFSNAFSTIGKSIVALKNAVLGSGSFSDIGKAINEGIAKSFENTTALNEAIEDSFAKMVIDSTKLIPEVTEDQVASKMRGFEKFGNFLKNLFKKKLDQTDALEALNQAIQKTSNLLKNQLLTGNKSAAAETFEVLQMLEEKLKGMEMQLAFMNDPFSAIQNAVGDLEGKLKNQIITGSLVDAQATFEELEWLKRELADTDKTIESWTSRQRDLDIGFNIQPVELGKLEIGGIKSSHAQVKELYAELKRLEEILKTTNNLTVYETAEKNIKKVKSELELFRNDIPKIGRSLISSGQESWNKWFEISKETLNKAKDLFADTFGQGLADVITNLFQGVDHERIKELNVQLSEQREILQDQGANNEQREAARAQIDAIEDQIKAEKLRGNVILQTADAALGAAKKVINSLLAEAIAGAIAGESKKGLLGLITAGIAVAGITALFRSKVPKLADGALLKGRTLFEGGEYPGASINPEVVTPLNKLQEHIRTVVKPIVEPIKTFIMGAKDTTTSLSYNTVTSSINSSLSSSSSQNNKTTTSTSEVIRSIVEPIMKPVETFVSSIQRNVSSSQVADRQSNTSSIFQNISERVTNSLREVTAPINTIINSFDPGSPREQRISSQMVPAHVERQVPYIQETRWDGDTMVTYLRRLDERNFATTGQGIFR